MNGTLKPGAFIKIVITEVFYKADAIYQQHMYFGAKLHRLHFFATDDGAYIIFVQRHNPVRHS